MAVSWLINGVTTNLETIIFLVPTFLSHTLSQAQKPGQNASRWRLKADARRMIKNIITSPGKLTFWTQKWRWMEDIFPGFYWVIFRLFFYVSISGEYWVLYHWDFFRVAKDDWGQDSSWVRARAEYTAALIAINAVRMSKYTLCHALTFTLPKTNIAHENLHLSW